MIDGVGLICHRHPRFIVERQRSTLSIDKKRSEAAMLRIPSILGTMMLAARLSISALSRADADTIVTL
jgi:hypothetical protein